MQVLEVADDVGADKSAEIPDGVYHRNASGGGRAAETHLGSGQKVGMAQKDAHRDQYEARCGYGLVDHRSEIPGKALVGSGGRQDEAQGPGEHRPEDGAIHALGAV